MDTITSLALPRNRVGDLKSLTQIVHRLDAATTQSCEDAVAHQRAMIACFCRFLGAYLNGESLQPVIAEASARRNLDEFDLPPRVRQTLGRLLAGDSEKQIAAKMGLSPHTVHCYVKSLYRSYEVSSRGELLSRFVTPDSSRGLHA